MKDKYLMDIVMKQDEKNYEIEDKVIITEKTLKKDKKVDVHWHDYFELEIILSGEAEHIYNNEKYLITKGNVFLMSYCDFHALKCLTDVDIVSIRFFNNFLDKELTDYISVGAGRFNVRFDENEFEEIIKQLDKVFCEVRDNKFFKSNAVKNYISQIIIDIVRKSNINSVVNMSSTVQKAIEHIYMNFRFDISVEKVAEKFNTSPNYFGTIFKKNVGVSFNEYVSMIRLKYACNLLKNTDLTVKEIAFSAGFNSVEYFMYVFKKKLFMTPNMYRNNT